MSNNHLTNRCLNMICNSLITNLFFFEFKIVFLDLIVNQKITGVISILR